jgi:hypothetical protein
MMMKIPDAFTLLASVTLLSGCGPSIWNAGDLADWVRTQAEQEGCVRDTVELEDWYRETSEGNQWHGTCADAATGNRRTFAINVDGVWSPSE